MKNGSFKEARVSLYVIAVIMIILALFYLVSSLFTSMGYKSYREAAAYDGQSAIDHTKTVVIDPGHGGEDPGTSANGLIEKDLNLSISLYLADMLESCGYNVILTRDSDKLLYGAGEENRKKYYDLYNRKLIADATEDSVFVSVHINQFPLESCKGLQTFYSKNDPFSVVLADCIQSSARLLQTDNERAIKDGGDNIFLLKEITRPAVLVECGFISNQYEASLLADDEYKKALALTVYCGIAEFLELKG